MPQPSTEFPPPANIGPYRVFGLLGRRHPATAYRVIPSEVGYIFGPPSQDFAAAATLNFTAYPITCSAFTVTPITNCVSRAPPHTLMCCTEKSIAKGLVT